MPPKRKPPPLLEPGKGSIHGWSFSYNDQGVCNVGTAAGGPYKRFAIDLLKSKNLRGRNWKGCDEPRSMPGMQAVGRLDADSTGLMLWTDDATLRQHIIGPRTPVDKEYLVRISGHESWSQEQMEDTLALLREGITLDDKPLLRAGVRRLNESQLQITLHEGRYRQIRRMAAIVGLKVEALKRVRIGKLRLGGLQLGCWTPLSPAQAATLLL